MHGVRAHRPAVPLAWAAMVAASLVGMFSLESAIPHVTREDGLWALAACADRNVHFLALTLGVGGACATGVFLWASWPRGVAHRAPALLVGPVQVVAVALVALVRPAADCADVVDTGPVTLGGIAGPLVSGLVIALLIAWRAGLLERDSGLPFGGTSRR